MAGFSWKQAILNADKNLMRQAITQATKGTQQAKLDHPDEVKDAQRGDYTKLKIRLTKELALKRIEILKRRTLLGNQQT